MLGDQADRVLEHGVGVGVQRLRLDVGRRLQQLLLERRLGLAAAGVDDVARLGLGDVCALEALQLGRAERLVEHVALAQQRLGAAGVEDHARVGLRRDGERDPRGHVGLDHARDDVDPRALGRQHQVDADGARLLREPDDRVLDLGRRDHHEVGQLVDHDQDVRHRVAALRGPGRVQLAQVAGLGGAHDLVAGLHLAHDVLEHERGVLHVRDDRRQQVRDGLVVVQLDPLGIDQDHAHVVRRRPQQDRAQDGVDAARLARAGGARDQQVRHPGEVAGDAVPRDVLAEPGRERARAGGQVGVDVAQRDEVGREIGHLDADRLLAGDRGEDADLGRRERVGQIVAQLGHAAHLDAGGELQLVPGDAGAAHHPHHSRLDAEVRQRLDELAGRSSRDPGRRRGWPRCA